MTAVLGAVHLPGINHVKQSVAQELSNTVSAEAIRKNVASAVIDSTDRE
jgi:hypothetical protein